MAMLNQKSILLLAIFGLQIQAAPAETNTTVRTINPEEHSPTEMIAKPKSEKTKSTAQNRVNRADSTQKSTGNTEKPRSFHKKKKLDIDGIVGP